MTMFLTQVKRNSANHVPSMTSNIIKAIKKTPWLRTWYFKINPVGSLQ